MFFEFAKKSHWLQNLIISVATSAHPMIMHNLGKIEMLKKAMFHCELEELEGDYLEFGVYEGASMRAAITAHRKLKSKLPRQFFGFDSFDAGFKYFDERDKHPFFREGDFVSSYERVKHRLAKFPTAHLVPGYFEETVAGKDVRERVTGGKCAILFIDCDLMGPARIALDYVAPALQAGSIVILDDYYAYRGDPKRGTCGAWSEFLAAHPTMQAREFDHYGYGGISFIITTL